MDKGHVEEGVVPGGVVDEGHVEGEVVACEVRGQLVMMMDPVLEGVEGKCLYSHALVLHAMYTCIV